MVDTLSASDRSAHMGRIKGKNTKPELLVRRLLFSMGYRYRLHRRSLPGTPDIVFAGRKKVIFVHGCFWHGHDDSNCKLARVPKSNTDFWTAKLAANVDRDQSARANLAGLGWSVLVVWECELGLTTELKAKLENYLEGEQ